MAAALAQSAEGWWLLDACGLPRPEWSAAAFDRLIAEVLGPRILGAPADV